MSKSPTEWRNDAPPQDGTAIYMRVTTIQSYRFAAYHPKSAQAHRGLKGRWQVLNEYAGWDNCPPPRGQWALEFYPESEPGI